MIVLWWCVAVLPSLCFSAELTEYNLANSVILSQKPGICIPTMYKYLRIRLQFGRTFQVLSRNLRKIEKEVGKYGSKAEPYMFVYYRVCNNNQKQGKTCPLATVTELTDKVAANARFDVITAVRKADLLINRAMALWNTYSGKFRQVEPAIPVEVMDKIAKWTPSSGTDSMDFDPTVQPPKNVLFPRVSRDVIDVFDFLRDVPISGAETLNVPTFSEENKANFTQEYQRIHAQLSMFTDTLQNLVDASQQLAKGYFPSDFVSIPSFARTLLDKPTGENLTDSEAEDVRIMMAYIQNLPMTTVKRSLHCDPFARLSTIKADCVLDIISLVPFQPMVQHLEAVVAMPHPVRRGEHWVKVQIPDEPLYKRGNNYYRAPVDPSCFPQVPSVDCTLCSSSVALIHLTNPCWKKIVAGDITSPPCVLVETNETDTLQVEYVKQGTDNVVSPQLIGSNDRAGQVQEVCPKHQSVINLPQNFKIVPGTDCKLNFIDGPDVAQLGGDYRYITSPITHSVTTRKEEEDPNTVKQHFKDYGYVYILVLLSLLGLSSSYGIGVVVKRRRRSQPQPQIVVTQTNADALPVTRSSPINSSYSLVPTNKPEPIRTFYPSLSLYEPNQVV